MSFASVDAARRQLCGLGTAVYVESPVALRRALRETAVAVMRAYAEPDTVSPTST